ncbi:DUF3817 domain-containing protein [Peribacillus acanthi]|uniref:DUF3817 domain-containing protein n=1 Tax=Peribacillus acanthi TaxID=2171554 RepID=UPI000D3E66D0|nr:DUF3817 domain-containing protein [Peribacillus acanthi]
MKKSLLSLRWLAISEGISYLVLLLIAMPLKYWAGIPEVVTVVGGLHGLLFVLYVFAVIAVKFTAKWSFLWAIWAVFLSFVPFGTFWIDKQVKKHI